MSEMNPKVSPEMLAQLKAAKEKLAKMKAEQTKAPQVKNAQVKTEKISERANAFQEIAEGSYVRIEPDEMTAWLYLKAPVVDEEYTPESLVTFLRKNNVFRGHHMSNLKAMARKGVYDREIKVAVGRVAKDGVDGYYEYLFSPVTTKAPEVRADGSVDYTSMNQLQNVHKGDVIAIYHHAVQGEIGYTVTGQEFKPRTAKELPILRGKGISHEENPDVYVAELEGKIELRDNKIDIKDVHEIMGDVDLVTGRVEFYGDVVINGSVSKGVMIRAGRNIVIKGTVEAVNMFAGGDIILERGIQGGQVAKLTARGSVFADFIEHTEVYAKGSVSANSILNSKVICDEKVVVSGKKGVIIGGYVHGLQGIESTNLGNEVEVKTIVHAGYEKETYERFIGIAEREEAAQEELAETVDNMADILRVKRLSSVSMTQRDEERLEELGRKKDECFRKLDDIRDEKVELQKQIEKGRGAKVITDGNVYPGVTIGVEDSSYVVEQKTSFMEYACLNGMVDASVRVM